MAFGRNVGLGKLRTSPNVKYMSFVIVLFPNPCDVFIDDQPQGSNMAASGRPRVLYVNAGFHIFRLGSQTQEVNVPERPILHPFQVVFV